MRLFLLISLLVAALPARARGAPSPDALVPGAPAPVRLFPGARLRVETQAGLRHSGELVSLMPEALLLRADAEQGVTLLLADVQRLETRKRAVGASTVAGLSLGAVSGGLFLGLICAFVVETEPNILPCLGGGALIGGALGTGAGAVMGLAVPRWSTLYEKDKHRQLVLRLAEPDEDVLARWFSGVGPIGELGVQVGYARDTRISQPTDGWGGRLHLLALIGPYFGIGPEVAWYGSVATRFQEPPLFQLGALLRLGKELGPVRASVLSGLGLFDKGSGHAGASVGGEVEVLAGGRVPVALEARYHFDLEREDRSDPDSLTLGVGTRVRW